MTGKTTIEWTHAPGFTGGVWNPTTGCTRVSAGCDNCYAFALHDKRHVANQNAAILATTPQADMRKHAIAEARRRGVKLPWPKQYDLPFSHVQLLPERLEVPLRVRKPTCYFVDSMADLFHEDVTDEFIERVFITMGNARQHRFLILTKRPERMRVFMTTFVAKYDPAWHTLSPHVWLGTSVEDQASADERIPHLLATPAAVRFLSCEPLIGPIYLGRLLGPASIVATPDGRLPLHWVIVGGESGPRARPMDLAWARSLVDQCRAVGVAPFVKQLGSEPVQGQLLIRETDGGERIDGYPTLGLDLRESHGRDMAEWPEDLRVREWPFAAVLA